MLGYLPPFINESTFVKQLGSSTLICDSKHMMGVLVPHIVECLSRQRDRALVFLF